MPDIEDMAAAAGQLERSAEQLPDEQSRLSRRSALRAAAAAGMAATALGAVSAPALAAARPARTGRSGHDDARQQDDGTDANEPIVVHVRNARTGEIDVFRGTSQSRLHDPALAAMLVRASR
jgi:hypothetical protein